MSSFVGGNLCLAACIDKRETEKKLSIFLQVQLILGTCSEFGASKKNVHGIARTYSNNSRSIGGGGNKLLCGREA